VSEGKWSNYRIIYGDIKYREPRKKNEAQKSQLGSQNVSACTCTCIMFFYHNFSAKTLEIKSIYKEVFSSSQKLESTT